MKKKSSRSREVTKKSVSNNDIDDLSSKVHNITSNAPYQIGSIDSLVNRLSFDLHNVVKYPNEKDFRVYEVEKKIADIKKRIHKLYEWSQTIATNV
jgi:hypothetical protein